jgi:hypothetical protein
MKYVLPTEAQWEHACRAGTATAYCFGEETAAFGQYAWYKENSAAAPHPVGKKNPNGWGLYDMHGNVWEWCADWYANVSYDQSSLDDPVGPEAGAHRVHRSGAWNNDAWFCRSAVRAGYTPAARHGHLGFRVAAIIPDNVRARTELKPPAELAGTKPPPPPGNEFTILPNGWVIHEPVNLGPTVNSTFRDAQPALSADGLTLMFSSDRPGGQGRMDLWMSTRASLSEPFANPVNLGPTVNSSSYDEAPGLSTDGLTFLFHSNRPGGQGCFDLWECTRASVSESFGEPVNLGPTVNSRANEWSPALSADGLTLLFSLGPPDGQDLWICTRASLTEPFARPVHLGPTVNSSARDVAPFLSPEGLTLLFTSSRPGGNGGSDIWMCTRVSAREPFGRPVNLGPTVNSTSGDNYAALSVDGRTLLFGSNRRGGRGGEDLWTARIEQREIPGAEKLPRTASILWRFPPDAPPAPGQSVARPEASARQTQGGVSSADCAPRRTFSGIPK